MDKHSSIKSTVGEATSPLLSGQGGVNPGDIIQPTTFKPASGRRSGKHTAIKPLSIAIAVLLAVCALIAWYLFTAKSVFIATNPPLSSLSLDGGFDIKLGDHYLVRPGEFVLRAEAEGYYPLQQSITVTEQQNQRFEFSLKKLPGHLTVNTSPTTAAEIWLDGKAIGTADTTLSGIPAGTHLLQVKTKRFKQYQQKIDIEGRDRQQKLSIELVPAWAEISINSIPPGAQLFVGDTAAGVTPLTAEVVEGERILTLKLVGHKSWQETLTIVAGEPITLPTIELAVADGLVMLNSQPQGAAITIDGQYHGQTPIEITLAPGKDYKVTLYRDGFQPAQRKFHVVSGEDLQVDVKLQAQLGKISIRSQPKDALVYIDGKLMGRANQVFTLPTHQHQISIKKEGFVDYQTQVIPRVGLEQIVSARLKTQEQAKWSTIKTTIVSPAGQTLKLFKPRATFTMGASRREQGRRANEVLQKISLTRPFYLAQTEVTNAQFRRFSKFHSSGHAKGQSLNNDRNPVVNISWQQAASYCNWLSTQEKLTPFYEVKEQKIVGFSAQSSGYRLPTEAEWAWAARFAHNKMRKYAWGSSLPPAPKAGNFADRSAAALLGKVLTNYSDGYAVTAPVGTFAANDKGIYDLSGNTAEWINDFYTIKTGLSRKTETDPLGPMQGDYHVIRGSSWAHGTITELRLSFRDYGADARNDVGFRIARFIE